MSSGALASGSGNTILNQGGKRDNDDYKTIKKDLSNKMEGDRNTVCGVVLKKKDHGRGAGETRGGAQRKGEFLSVRKGGIKVE